MTNNLSVSIVLHDTPNVQVDEIMHSILNTEGIDYIYIIENSLDDRWRILERLSSKIRYIHSENRGYGAGHNIAIKEVMKNGVKYHVILNPDISFKSDVLGKIASFMDKNEDVGCVMPKVVYPNGEIQYLCKLLPTPSDLIIRRFLPKNKWTRNRNDRYTLKEFGYNRIINPPCLSGCFMFLRVATLKQHDMLFDERFFMYFEDYDLIRRIHRIARTLFWPEVTIVHDHQGASHKSRKMLAIHLENAKKYFDKYGWFFDKERNLMNKRILDEIRGSSRVEIR